MERTLSMARPQQRGGTALNVSALLLCDFAQIRDGLLFVASGGVSRVYRNGVPARLGLYLAMIVDMTADEAGHPHDLAVQVVDRTGNDVASVNATFKVGDEGVFYQERQHVPFVVSLADLEVGTWGTHEVRLRLNDQAVGTVTCYVLPSEAF